MLISQVCEEFPGCSPSQAQDWLLDDHDLIFEIIGIRRYIEAKAYVKRTKTGDLDMSLPMVKTVFDVEALKLKERIKARLARSRK